MKFEFLIACHINSETDIHQQLCELLSQVLENNRAEFDEDFIDQMIQISHKRPGDEFVDNDGESTCLTLIGFTLELSEMDSAEAESVVNDFAKSLSEPAPIFHAVKFEDALLQDDLTQRATEIFTLEMKLRRVLSFIYLHAYQGEEPYDLLQEEQIKPSTEQSKPEQMRAVAENQFFHLTFRQYRNLNERQSPNLPEVLRIISDSEQYDVLRDEIMRSPIVDEQDTSLLNDLKELMDPIERMRNCVAHNRKPNTRLTQNYPRAHSYLEDRLDAYLAGLEC